MINCKQVAYLLTSGEMERQSWWKRSEVRVHLWMCRNCSRLARQLEQIRKAGLNLRSKLESEISSGGPGQFEERILKSLGPPPPNRPPSS